MNPTVTSLRYGSVCSGIEAVTVAWQPLGLAPVWFTEIDPFANAVLAHHYPQVPNLGDFTRLTDQVRCGAVRAPDILVGGTPCQSFSVAGIRRGLTDPRGALTLRYVELADAIDHTRLKHDQPPAVLVWENVPGVLSDRANAFGCFLGAISGEGSVLQPAGTKWTNAGCVYGPQRSVAWRVLDAQYFGLAQRRKRVFLVASARDDFDSGAVLFESDCMRRDSSPSPQMREDVAHAVVSSAIGSGRHARYSTKVAGQETLTGCFGGGNTHGPIDVAACLTSRGYKNDFKTETFSVQTPSGAVSHPLTGATSVIEDGNGRGVPIIASPYRIKGGRGPTCYSSASVAFAQNSRGELRLEGGAWRADRRPVNGRGQTWPGHTDSHQRRPPRPSTRRQGETRWQYCLRHLRVHRRWQTAPRAVSLAGNPRLTRPGVRRRSALRSTEVARAPADAIGMRAPTRSPGQLHLGALSRKTGVRRPALQSHRQ